jgi:hypothetical protein
LGALTVSGSVHGGQERGAAQVCAGDCDGGGEVSVDELITCVSIALGAAEVATCAPCDINQDQQVRVDELVGAVNAALTGCPLPLRVGVSVVRLTPCGENPEWDGPITESGVWGETFTDLNGNGRWDRGEPFVDDPVNSQLDPFSEQKYDGIYMAGFGHDRIALGCHDDLWARVIVLEAGRQKVALVSVDFVGTIVHGRYYGFGRVREMIDPVLGLDAILFSSTHNHEGPDTLGLWGPSEFVDGKFPRYLQFVDRQIARAVTLAAEPAAMRPATVVAARATPATAPGLRGLQVRTGCRPPFFFDEELRALRFLDEESQTIATLINWNTHPESLEDENTEISSDFIHFVRERVENELGGTAVYFTGDLGAVEIVGDTCVGGADPHGEDGTNEFDSRDDIGFPRTQQLGELVGAAALAALREGEVLPVTDLLVESETYRVSGSNAAFLAANTLGILDLDLQAFDIRNCPPGAVICVPVEQSLLTLSDQNGTPLVQLVTLPGEVFPELVYGVAEHRRTDCPEADTGAPPEPSIREAMTAPYRLFLGLSPDELGYIVPGYDFYPPPDIGEEARDPCQGQMFDPEFPRRRVPSHYHETLSVGFDMGPATTCYAVGLLGDEGTVSESAACQRILPQP